jgi:hypothetical protein
MRLNFIFFNFRYVSLPLLVILKSVCFGELEFLICCLFVYQGEYK